MTDSAEWADVADSDHSLIKPPRFTFQAGSSQVASGSCDQSSSKMWSEVAGSQKDGRPWLDESFSSESVQHKAQVAPVYLAYHHVQSGGASIRIPLFQIATAVAQAVGGTGLDAVQPMKSGWYIYM